MYLLSASYYNYGYSDRHNSYKLGRTVMVRLFRIAGAAIATIFASSIITIGGSLTMVIAGLKIVSS